METVVLKVESEEVVKLANTVQQHFLAKFKYEPQFYVRVPGRVNIIGEHIDYNGFAVLPMAIELNIMIAVGCNKDKTLNLTNAEVDKYEDFSTPIDSFVIDKAKVKWYNYFLCGVKGIMDDSGILPRGMDVAVYGNIPPASGLSSSSALVCAAAAATSYVSRISLSKMSLATICAKSERYVGTEGGGMDQAIAFLAESGTAKYISFDPLFSKTVELPEGGVFVVGNSCAPINKAATSHFNTRVVECKIAAKILAKEFEIEASRVNRLKDIPIVLYGDMPKNPHPLTHVPFRLLPREVKKCLHEKPYTREEICELLEITESELESLYLTDNTKGLKEFKLYQRACHVYEEAYRVMKFKETCENVGDTLLEELGQLMYNSHISCRDLYECSHPDLDEFVELAMGAGALGARLTGAGWGGCCIALIKEEKLESFLKEMKSKYYMKHPHRSKDLVANLFPTQPGPGAKLYVI